IRDFTSSASFWSSSNSRSVGFIFHTFLLSHGVWETLKRFKIRISGRINLPADLLAIFKNGDHLFPLLREDLLPQKNQTGRGFVRRLFCLLRVGLRLRICRSGRGFVRRLFCLLRVGLRLRICRSGRGFVRRLFYLPRVGLHPLKRRTVRGSVPHPFGLVSLYLLDFRTVLGYFYQPLQPPFGVTDVPKHKTKQLAFVQPTLGPSAE